MALDPATACGFAVGYRNADGGFQGMSGEWDLRRNKHDAWAMTPIKLKQKLTEIHKVLPFEHLGYEAARRHLGTDAAHLAGAFYAAIQEWCLENNVPFEGIPVGSLKKFWTGKGNASKDEMIAAAQKRGFNPATDNEADALAGWHWLMAQSEQSPNLDRDVKPSAGPSVVSEHHSSHSKIIPSEAAE